jgi:hypothetical protein
LFSFPLVKENSASRKPRFIDCNFHKRKEIQNKIIIKREPEDPKKGEKEFSKYTNLFREVEPQRRKILSHQS